MGTVAVDSEELERLTNEAHKAVLLQEKLNSLESLRTSEAERAFAMDLSVRNAGASLTKTLTDILGSLRRHSLRTVTWLREENLPDGSDTGALCAWLVTVFAALPSMAADNARMRQELYGKRSEQLRSGACMAAENRDPLDETQNEDKSPARPRLRDMTPAERAAWERKEAARASVAAARAAESGENHIDGVLRDADRIKARQEEAARHAELSRRFEVMAAEGKSGTDSGHGDHEDRESHDDHYGYDDHQSRESHDDHNGHLSKEPHKSRGRRPLSRGMAARAKTGRDCLTVRPEAGDTVSRYCPECGCVHEFKVIPRMERGTKRYAAVAEAVNTIRSMSVTIECPVCQTRIELNAATASSVEVSDADGKTALHLDDRAPGLNGSCGEKVPPSVYPQSSEELKLKEETARCCSLSPSLLHLCVVSDMLLRYDPWLFEQSAAPSVYGSRPLYCGGRLSQGYVLDLLYWFGMACLPKTRAHRCLGDRVAACMEEAASRGWIIQMMNSTVRTFFHRIAERIRKEMITENRVVHMDESRFMCLSLPGGTNYVWVMVSGAREEKQAVSYWITADRGHENILRFLGLGYAPCDESSLPENINTGIRVLTTDRYGAYTAFSEKMRELYDLEVEQSLCYAHARREILGALKAMGLAAYYGPALDSLGWDGFEKGIEDFLRAGGLKGGLNVQCGMLTCMYLTDALFHTERLIEGAGSEKRAGTRRTVSLRLVDRLFKKARELISLDPGIAAHGDSAAGRYTHAGTEWGKALAYLLNGESGFRTFILNPDVSLHNNSAEQAVKAIIELRNSSFVAQSADGAMAMADLMTVISTFRLCAGGETGLRNYMEYIVQQQKLWLDIERGTKGLTLQNCRAMKRMSAEEAVNPCEAADCAGKEGGEEKTAGEKTRELELKRLSDAHRYPWGNYYHPHNHAQTDHFDGEMTAALTPWAWQDFRRKCTPPDKQRRPVSKSTQQPRLSPP